MKSPTPIFTPFRFQSNDVRTMSDDNGDVWFVAKDVCDVLGIGNPSDAVSRLEDDEKNTLGVSEGIQRGNPNHTIISESGLYSIIFRSNKPEAKIFRKWVTSEVLPSIRKTGTYSVPGKESFPSATAVPVAREFRALLSIAKLAGLKGNPAILSASNATRKLTGINPLQILDVNLVTENQIRHFNPSELGMMMGGLSGVKFNRLLEENGFQESVRDGKRKYWMPTETGRPYSVLVDTGKRHTDGVMVQQLRWLETVLARVKEVIQ